MLAKISADTISELVEKVDQPNQPKTVFSRQNTNDSPSNIIGKQTPIEGTTHSQNENLVT